MTPDDFFVDSGRRGTRELDHELLERICAGTETAQSDVEIGVALLRLAHDELEAYGTDRSQRTDDNEIYLVLQACRRLLGRIDIGLNLPFGNYRSFESYWLKQGSGGSWQARRDILSEFFEPVHQALMHREDEEFKSTLAQPITSHAGTGWIRVDAEINALRRHFASARTEQDYRNIGNDCTAVLERLSEIVFDPKRHLQEGEEAPPSPHTKRRFELFLDAAAAGPADKEIRKLARAVIELAQAVKHQSTPSRRDAGIAADSVIQLTNILRRLAEP